MLKRNNNEGMVSEINKSRFDIRFTWPIWSKEKGDQLRSVSLFVILITLVFILISSITLAVMLGPVSIRPDIVWKIILSNTPLIDGMWEEQWSVAQSHIVWDIRFPRVLLGAIVGAGLATVGVAIQALVRNSLADPYILGISSGASVGATLVILFGAFSLFGAYALSVSAFFGALASISLVFMLAKVGKRITTTRLLLAGIAVSMILSALTNLIVISAPNEHGMKSAMFWMMGSLAGARWDYLWIPALVVIIGIIYLLVQSRSLNILLMGDETANTLGVNVEKFRRYLFIFTALLTGVIVAVSGAIGFVGLMIPHISRMLVGSNHLRVLFVSPLLGAIFIIWADVVARLLLSPEELPIGIITAMCGGPFFVWLLRRRSYSFGGGD